MESVDYHNYSDSGNYFDIREIGYVNAAVFLLFIIVGIPLNILVMVVIFKKIFSQPSLMLMFNLALGGLLLCFLHMPIPIIAGIAGYSREEVTDWDGACEVASIL